LEQKTRLGNYQAPVNSPKVNTQLWFRDGYSLVYNKNQMTIKNENEMKKIKDALFIFFNKDNAPTYYNSLLEICAGYQFVPNVVHESNNIGSIIQLIRNGLGVSIVPSQTEKNHHYEEIGYLKLKKTRLFTEVLLATPGHLESEISQAAIAFLKNQYP
jgi:DNA-binding transcriptional LysR family regulator